LIAALAAKNEYGDGFLAFFESIILRRMWLRGFSCRLSRRRKIGNKVLTEGFFYGINLLSKEIYGIHFGRDLLCLGNLFAGKRPGLIC